MEHDGGPSPRGYGRHRPDPNVRLAARPGDPDVSVAETVPPMSATNTSFRFVVKRTWERSKPNLNSLVSYRSWAVATNLDAKRSPFAVLKDINSYKMSMASP